MNPNEETLAFYYQIGLTITQWAHVEFALTALACHCFTKGNYQTAHFGYSSIENFRAKLQYLDAVLQTKGLSKDEQANWATLFDQTARAVKKRNKLAHYSAIHNLQGQSGRRSRLSPMRPDASDGEKRGQKHPGAIYVRDVAGFQREFFALMVALENFQDRLVGRKERFPKSLEQPTPPQTLAEIRRMIYSYARTPPRPSRA